MLIKRYANKRKRVFIKGYFLTVVQSNKKTVEGYYVKKRKGEHIIWPNISFSLVTLHSTNCREILKTKRKILRFVLLFTSYCSRKLSAHERKEWDIQFWLI